MGQAAEPGRQNAPPERTTTVLETDEEIRRALGAAMKGGQEAAIDAVKAAQGPAPALGRTASPYRPTVRPPVPILTVYDDGKLDGEIIRIRGPRFTIGRSEGDLKFLMDGRMSSRHVEISHQVVGGLHRWVVTDLQSTHGMFVRVSRTPLADRAEFLAGNGRYRFDANRPERDATVDHVPNTPVPEATRGWDDGTATFRPPSLTEILGNDIGNRVLLVKEEYWIGSDPSCQVCRSDDAFCEPRHVRLYRGSKGNWHAEHNRTHNGLWLRMTQIPVDSTVHFQAGEQRFKIKVS